MVSDTEPDSVQRSVCYWTDLYSDQLDTLLLPPERPPVLYQVMSPLQLMKMLSPVPTCTAQPRGGLAGHPLYSLRPWWSGGEGECSQSGPFGEVSVGHALEKSWGCCQHFLDHSSLGLQVVWLHDPQGWRVVFLGYGAGNTSQVAL